ncbi:hypothetical protein [Desulfoluna spongiiphila]|uniref:hypothetical protein n=1 Tax=Desulfoluna spongiiphila TaxID=419481 RepID=UPI0012597BE7|nr:hypothetical protein [Desulfoluna spongiiphila]VVS90988.1 hypothetical protein DBB_5560 [Desulfoluna spongiiphila]
MESVDRFYRLYMKYVHEYDFDSLFNLLNALHSLNDKLKLIKKHKVNLYDFEEFLTLKAIRNYLYHQEDARNRLIVAPISPDMPFQTDLAILCLITKSDLDAAINGIEKRFRKDHKEIINKMVHFYGDTVNISHVIFNMASKLILFLNENGIHGKSEEYLENKMAVESDINNDYSITVSGKLYGPVGTINRLWGILNAEVQI